MFAGFLVGDDNNQFRDLSTRHPLIQLRHDLLDIGLHLIIGGHWQATYQPWPVEKIFEGTGH